MVLGKCNCGRDARYITGTDTDGAEWSCNKYKACPPYSQIEAELAQTKKDIQELLAITDALRFFREGTDYYKDAECKLCQYKSQYNKREIK